MHRRLGDTPPPPPPPSFGAGRFAGVSTALEESLPEGSVVGPLLAARALLLRRAASAVRAKFCTGYA
jgi:hypothetical protein